MNMLRKLFAWFTIAAFLGTGQVAQAVTDQQAQTMAQRALSTKADARQTRLRNLMAAASVANPMTLPPLDTIGAAPVITAPTSLPASFGKTVRITTPADAALFTVYGGAPLVSTSRTPNFWQVKSVSFNPAFPQNQVLYNTYGSSNGSRISWRTDSPNFILYTTYATGGNKYRLLVDGQYVSLTGFTPNPNSTLGINQIDWSATATPRKMRRYDLELDITGGFVGLQLNRNDTLQKVDTSAQYNVVVFGDSIATGTGADSSGLPVTRGPTGDQAGVIQAGYRLGGVNLNMVSASIGGTGYVGPGVNQWTVQEHLDDIFLPPSVDEIWFVAGANDGYVIGTPQALARPAAMLAAFRGARARAPNAPIIVFGPLLQTNNASADMLAVETDLKAAFDTFADPNSAFIPTLTASQPVFSGRNGTKATANISGTTLSLTANVLAQSGTAPFPGDYVTGPGVAPGTIVTDVTGYVVTQTGTIQVSPSQTVSSTTMLVQKPGNWSVYGGGLDGLDPVHPSYSGHGYLGSWYAEARRAVGL